MRASAQRVIALTCGIILKQILASGSLGLWRIRRLRGYGGYESCKDGEGYKASNHASKAHRLPSRSKPREPTVLSSLRLTIATCARCVEMKLGRRVGESSRNGMDAFCSRAMPWGPRPLHLKRSPFRWSSCAPAPSAPCSVSSVWT